MEAKEEKATEAAAAPVSAQTKAAPAPAAQEKTGDKPKAPEKQPTASTGGKQSLISVNLQKLDQLHDIVGEIITTESMVISNPELDGLRLESFSKAARELRKLTDELQKTSAGVEVLLVDLQVLGEVTDTNGQDCNLNLRRTGVLLVLAVLLDELCYLLLGDAVPVCHVFHLSYKIRTPD